jgi:hypothetical protein
MLPGCLRMLRAARRASWRAKLLAVTLAMIVGYPVFDAVNDATPHRIRQRGDVWVCDLRTLSNFDLDQINGRTEDIPRELRDLDGKRVQMRGQMWSPNDADGRLRNFELVYSIANCCFSGPPKVQHLVKAKLHDGAVVRYAGGRVDVIGTLHVGVQKDGDAIDSVYRVDVESVSPD